MKPKGPGMDFDIFVIVFFISQQKLMLCLDVLVGLQDII